MATSGCHRAKVEMWAWKTEVMPEGMRTKLGVGKKPSGAEEVEGLGAAVEPGGQLTKAEMEDQGRLVKPEGWGTTVELRKRRAKMEPKG